MIDRLIDCSNHLSMVLLRDSIGEMANGFLRVYITWTVVKDIFPYIFSLFFSIGYVIHFNEIVRKIIEKHVIFVNWLGMARIKLAEWNLDVPMARRVWRELLCTISGEKQKTPDLHDILDWIRFINQSPLEEMNNRSRNMFGCILRSVDDNDSRNVFVYRRPHSREEREALMIKINEEPGQIDRELYWDHRWYLRIRGECRPGEFFHVRSFVPRTDLSLCTEDQKSWLRKFVPHECLANLLVLHRIAHHRDPMFSSNSVEELKLIVNDRSILKWYHLTIEACVNSLPYHVISPDHRATF
jgi:hypothetical protein